MRLLNMATDPMLKLPGKTQTILLTETKSERWLSWIRLGCVGVMCSIFLPVWIIGATNKASFLLQALAIAILSGYSLFYLLLTKHKRRIAKEHIYFLTLCDIMVITAVLWSSIDRDPLNNEISNIAFSAFFIAIAFTAFHHRISLALFSGGLAVAGYTSFSWAQYAIYPDYHVSVGGYCARIALLCFAAALSAAVSRKNYQTVRKVLLSDLRYDSLVERLPEMIFTLNANGEVVWSNKGCSDLLGISQEKLIGLKINSFFKKPEMFKLDLGWVKTTLEIHDQQGHRKYVDCMLQRAIRTTTEEAFEGMMVDVTDREQAISQREEMIDRLFQYQKMESLGSLASGMAHDFNNILQTVIDISTMVSKESAELETKKRMELILETTADASFLISELLALGRKKLLAYRHIDVKGFFIPLITQFSHQFGANYSLQFKCPDEHLKIQGDADYLKRVFQNLFGNAKDAMPQGGSITITCSALKGHAGNGTVIIKISDTGTGIPFENTEKIFDPFFTTKKIGKGTGLGLALVRRIIVLHNGRVFVETTSSAGTTFRIELPMVSHEETEADTKSIMLNRLGATIIILEDDPKIRDIMKFFLKEFDYSILEASSSDEAATHLTNNRDACRILITDWKLAGEKPHQAITKLRSIKEDLIVIVVSGYPPVSQSIETLRIYRWFTKPYDKNALDIEIQRALRGMAPRSER